MKSSSFSPIYSCITTLEALRSRGNACRQFTGFLAGLHKASMRAWNVRSKSAAEGRNNGRVQEASRIPAVISKRGPSQFAEARQGCSTKWALIRATFLCSTYQAHMRE